VGAAVVGLAVLTVWLFIESLNVAQPATIVGYQRTGDPRKIVIVVAIGRLDEIAERQIQEDASTVRVTVHKRSSSGTAPSDLIFLPVTVTLREPLRERAVLDDKGQAVRERGTYELPQPTGSS
jgi:hypothetical protein